MTDAPDPPAPWPAALLPAGQVLAWLNAHHAHLGALLGGQRATTTLRWLVLAELDRSAPERLPKPADMPDFTPQTPPD